MSLPTVTQFRPPVAPDQHPVMIYLSTLGPNSRRAMRGRLERFAEELSGGRADALGLDWSRVEYQHVAAVRQKLLDAGSAPATVNQLLSAVKGTMKQCWMLGQIGAEQYHRIAAVPVAKGTRLPKGRSLSQEEIRAIMAHALTARDRAIVAVAYAGGLRRSEIVGLDVDDVSLETGAIRVRGKGNKERRVYIANGSLGAVREWIGRRGVVPGPLFWAERTWNRLTSEAIYRVFKRLAARAEIPEISPHDLRRTLAGDLLSQGTDIVTVQKILGHASPNTTAQYDRRPDDAKRAAAEKLHI